MAEKKKLTISTVDKIPFEAGASQRLYWDAELIGFGLRVGAKSKTYIVQKEVDGRTTRTTIGRHGVFTPQKAREEAIKLLGRFAQGVNVNQERKAKKERGKTLGEVYKEFRKMGLKRLRPSTLRGYDDFIENSHLKLWADTPMNQITKEMVRKQYLYFKPETKDGIGTKLRGQSKKKVRSQTITKLFAGHGFVTLVPLDQFSTVKIPYDCIGPGEMFLKDFEDIVNNAYIGRRESTWRPSKRRQAPDSAS